MQIIETFSAEETFRLGQELAAKAHPGEHAGRRFGYRENRTDAGDCQGLGD